MRIGNKKPPLKPTLRRPQQKIISNQRVHSYYTTKQYSGDKLSSAKRLNVNKESILKSVLLKRLAVMMFVIFVLFTVSVLSDEPIIFFADGQAVTAVDRYSQDIQGLLGSSLFNSNKFTLQQESLANTVKERFPELRSVTFSTVVLGKKPLVRLDVYKLPIRLLSKGEVYIVAENGVVVGKEMEFPLARDLLSIKEESGIEIHKSDKLLRSDDVQFLSSLKAILQAKGRGVEYIRLTAVPREIFVKPSDKNYEIRMYLDDDVQQQVGSWLTVERVVGESGGQVAQYIDVRAGEKVFWQ